MKKLFCVVVTMGTLLFLSQAVFAQNGGGSTRDTAILAVHFIHTGQAKTQVNKKTASESKGETYMAIVGASVRFFRITCIKCDILKWSATEPYPAGGAAIPVTDPVLKKELMSLLKAQMTSIGSMVQKV